MYFLFHYYQRRVYLDFLLKYNYYNFYEIPKLKNISLNFPIKTKDKILTLILHILLVLITSKNPFIVRAKKPNPALGIVTGQVVGIKVSLEQYYIYRFICILWFYLNKVEKNVKKYSFSSANFFSFNFKFLNLILNIDPRRLKTLPKLDVVIISSCKKVHELKLLLQILEIKF